MRRLPMIQPPLLERRGFLLCVVGAAVAACSSSEDTVLGGHSTSSGGTSGSSGGSGTDAGDGEDDLDASVPGRDGSADASSPVDSSTAPMGCAAAGTDIGDPSTYKMGTLTLTSTTPLALIGRDAGGLYAMLGLCTHAFGNLRIDATQLTCLVHGAKFSYNGDLQPGAPGGTVSLLHYSLCLNSKGNLAIDLKTFVPATTRLVA